MTDILLAPNDREEALSRASVAAVAASAGYATTAMDFDRDGVDIGIRAGGSMRPSLDIQLKATINLGDAVEGAFRYALRRCNYDLLREPTMVPRILVVLSLPEVEAEWLIVGPEQLVMRRCAYWALLKDLPETGNAVSVTIPIKNDQRFDVQALRALMDRARSGAVS